LRSLYTAVNFINDGVIAMIVLNPEDFPYIEAGTGILRKIRLLTSPFTTDQKGMSLVSVNIPAGGISEGHIHKQSDEYIYFDAAGKAIVDGKEYEVPAKSIVFAPKGKKHECINTSSIQELNLICFFVPPFEAYGQYPQLIEKTKQFLANKV
jgi:quercetin dioxygenase-like cupin family protein